MNETMGTQTTDSNMKQAGREKYWKELTVEEKVERMRINVKSLAQRQSQLHADMESMWRHSHEENGQIIMKIPASEKWKLQQTYNDLGASIDSALSLSKISEDEVFF